MASQNDTEMGIIQEERPSSKSSTDFCKEYKNKTVVISLYIFIPLLLICLALQIWAYTTSPEDKTMWVAGLAALLAGTMAAMIIYMGLFHPLAT